MAGNAIELITKYSDKAWDKVYKARSMTSLLEGENTQLKFVGIKTVKIAKVETSGLSDYERANNPATGSFGGDGHETSFSSNEGYGYQQGNVNVKWEEFTLAMDRGVQLRIALFDDEESAGIAVGAATTETMRVRVIPEMDAYRFSKIAKYAIDANLTGHVITKNVVASTTVGVVTEADPIGLLNKAFQALADSEVPEEDQIIFCSTSFMTQLRNSAAVVKTLRQSEYAGKVKFTIENYEGREIVVVPPSRFRTAFKALQGGYGWETGSLPINFIVCSKEAIIPVVKYEKQRVFGPEVVQDFDGYKVNVRVYHDLFVMDNKIPGIVICLPESGAELAPLSTRALSYDSSDSTSTKIILKDLVVNPINGKGGVLVRKLYAVATTMPAIGAAVPDGAIALTAGDDIGSYECSPVADGSYYIFGADNGIVTAHGSDSAIVIDVA